MDRQPAGGAAAARRPPYAPQQPVEVSLALPASDASSARVLFEGEPLKVKYAVVGKCPGALLKARLVTLYGDQKLLPAVKLTAASLSTGVLTAEAFKQHPLGAYRLEAWVEDAAGKKLSAENEVVFYRLHRPPLLGQGCAELLLWHSYAVHDPPPDDGEGGGLQLGAPA